MPTLRIVALSLLLSACAAPPTPKTSAEVAAVVEKRQTAFDRVATFVGPEQFVSVPRGMLSDRVHWRIRAFQVSGVATTGKQLLVSIWHQDRTWRFYTTATYEGGGTLDVTRISSEPRCMAGGGLVTCSYTETVGVVIPSAKWAAAQHAGLKLRLNAKSGGDVVIEIPADYMAGIMKATGESK